MSKRNQTAHSQGGTKVKQVLFLSLHQDIFDSLKQAILTAPVLKVVDSEKPFVVESDTNGVAIGAILSQEG